MQQRVHHGGAGPAAAGSPGKHPSAIDLKVERRPIGDLEPNPHNARTHNRKQIRAILSSIRRLGFNNPILVDQHDMIIAGEGRWKAATLLGMTEVPVIRLDHLSPDEIRAYMLADNQLATRAGWDPEILAIELQHLVEVDFDIDVTGFEAPEVDKLIETQLTGPGSDRADRIPEPPAGAPTTRLGDIWALDQHRLGCGNALDERHLGALMGGARASLIFTDPPFNVPISGHVCGSGATQHREFAMAFGEMSPEEFMAFLRTALANAARVSVDGALHYCCMDWRHIGILLQAAADIYTEFINLCVWNKTNAGMGSFYRSQHELVAVFKHGTASHRNNIQLGRYGRNRSNVWSYAGVNTFRTGRMEELSSHPTVKPVALVADAIRDASRRGDVVLDPFMGSGTTIIAAEETGRIACGLELDPVYVDVAVRRWETLTGGTARLASTGATFSNMAATRNAPVPLPPPAAPTNDEEA